MNRKQNVLASVLLEGGRLDIPRGDDRRGGGGVSLSHGKCSVNGLDIGFQLGVEHVISLGWGNKIMLYWMYTAEWALSKKLVWLSLIPFIISLFVLTTPTLQIINSNLEGVTNIKYRSNNDAKVNSRIISFKMNNERIAHMNRSSFWTNGLT